MVGTGEWSKCSDSDGLHGWRMDILIAVGTQVPMKLAPGRKAVDVEGKEKGFYFHRLRNITLASPHNNKVMVPGSGMDENLTRNMSQLPVLVLPSMPPLVHPET